jgi:hypothetical protein
LLHSAAIATEKGDDAIRVLPFARLQAWAQACNDAILVERRKVAPFGIYTLVCFERAIPSAA